MTHKCFCKNCIASVYCENKRLINQYDAVVKQNRDLQKELRKYKLDIHPSLKIFVDDLCQRYGVVEKYYFEKINHFLLRFDELYWKNKKLQELKANIEKITNRIKNNYNKNQTGQLQEDINLILRLLEAN